MLKIGLYLLSCMSLLAVLKAEIREQDIAFFRKAPEANYLVIYQVPKKVPSGVNNLMLFFDTVRTDGAYSFLDSLFMSDKNAFLTQEKIKSKSMSLFFEEIPYQVEHEVPLCSKEQIQLIQQYTKQRGVHSVDRFYDATELLKPFLMKGFPCWCVFDAQESQLFVYSSSVLHACFLNYIARHMEATPIVQSLEVAICSVTHTGPSLEESVSKAVDQVHHMTARASTSAGETASIKIANGRFSFEADITTYMTDPYSNLDDTSTNDMDFSFESSLFSCRWNQSFILQSRRPQTLKMGLSKDESRCYFFKLGADFRKSNSFRLLAKHEVNWGVDENSIPQEVRTLSLSMSDLTAKESTSFFEIPEMRETDKQGECDLTKLYQHRFSGLKSVSYSKKREILEITAVPSTINFISSFKKKVETPVSSGTRVSIYKIKEDVDELDVEDRDLLSVINGHQPIYSHSHGKKEGIKNERNNSFWKCVYSADFFQEKCIEEDFFSHMFNFQYQEGNMNIQLENFCISMHETDPPILICHLDGYSYIAMSEMMSDLNQ